VPLRSARNRPVGTLILTTLLALGNGCSDPLPPELGGIAGTVTDAEDDAPIVGASVTAGGSSTTTSVDGRFVVSNIPVGNYSMDVEAADYIGVASTVSIAANAQTKRDVALPRDCLGPGSGDAIQSRLTSLGSQVALCPGSEVALTSAIEFTNDNQQLRTWGYPTGDERALLYLSPGAGGSALELRDRSDVVISHLRIDGRIAELGPADDGGALIQAGGTASGQVIRSVEAGNTRTWTIIHLAEGDEDAGGCRNATVEDGVFGPARGLGVYDWADGISLACRSSTIRNNVIFDPSDGGIVIFGAPGSVVEGNTIRATNHQLLGGINLVDYGPYDGDYTGTIVRNNIVDAAGARIQIGIAMGVRVWICFNPEDRGDLPEDPTLRGATVIGNTLQGDFMGYGFAISGVQNWTATDNVDLATHSGQPKNTCNGELAAAPSGFQISGALSAGTFQAEFQQARLELALWSVDDPPQIPVRR